MIHARCSTRTSGFSPKNQQRCCTFGARCAKEGLQGQESTHIACLDRRPSITRGLYAAKKQDTARPFRANSRLRNNAYDFRVQYIIEAFAECKAPPQDT